MVNELWILGLQHCDVASALWKDFGLSIGFGSFQVLGKVSLAANIVKIFGNDPDLPYVVHLVGVMIKVLRIVTGVWNNRMASFRELIKLFCLVKKRIPNFNHSELVSFLVEIDTISALVGLGDVFSLTTKQKIDTHN